MNVVTQRKLDLYYPEMTAGKRLEFAVSLATCSSNSTHVKSVKSVLVDRFNLSKSFKQVSNEIIEALAEDRKSA